MEYQERLNDGADALLGKKSVGPFFFVLPLRLPTNLIQPKWLPWRQSKTTWSLRHRSFSFEKKKRKYTYASARARSLRYPRWEARNFLLIDFLFMWRRGKNKMKRTRWVLMFQSVCFILFSVRWRFSFLQKIKNKETWYFILFWKGKILWLFEELHSHYWGQAEEIQQRWNSHSRVTLVSRVAHSIVN